MKDRCIIPLVFALLALLGAPRAFAQGWDPVKSATGWASFDRDGSCVFLDGTRRLQVWSRDTGVTDTLDLSRLSAAAEKWVLDPSGNAWVVAGATLQMVDKGGKPGPAIALPTEVSDLAWDARGFVLCYRTREPYLERRDLKTGAVLWTYGPRPAKGNVFPPERNHVVITEDGRVFLSSGAGFQLEELDVNKGVRLETVTFTRNGAPSPTLALVGDGGRGALAWWLNANVALTVVPASQLPPGEFQGLVLAKLDLAGRTLTLTPTGADEKAALVGIVENSYVLRGPAGGLTFLPIP